MAWMLALTKDIRREKILCHKKNDKKDRRDYPHKLANAIEAYGLGDQVVNSHRAVDDARATVALLEAMSEERGDLVRYIDLFGTHPKYGMNGRKISSVTYRPQSYQRIRPLYEQG